VGWDGGALRRSIVGDDDYGFKDLNNVAYIFTERSDGRGGAMQVEEGEWDVLTY